MTAPDAASDSPYQRALGERLAELHPKTAWYFRTIPDGRVGRGTGVFTRAGSPHLWLRPAFLVAERLGVAFAGRERDVPFRIENRTQNGKTVSVRHFELPGRTWTMTDTVTLLPGRVLRTEIGPRRTVVCTFDIAARDGAVVLTVRRVGLRFGGLRVAVPPALGIRLGLVERWDTERERHHVNMTIDAPLLGRVYEYTGFFEYAIESETP